MASTSNRGKNWIESDSLILIDAYQSVMSSKRGTILTFSTVDLLDGESASILNDRIAAQFLASSPVVSFRMLNLLKRDGSKWWGLTGTKTLDPILNASIDTFVTLMQGEWLDLWDKPLGSHSKSIYKREAWGKRYHILPNSCC